MGRVSGKVALVTGAARGQGRSHAIRLAEEGADIIAVDICKDIETVPYAGSTRADLDETVAAVEGLGRKIVAFEGDVRDADGLKKLVDEGVEALGRLDIVSANAGVMTFGTGADTSDELWDVSYEINLKGVYHTLKAAYPHLRDAGGGSIIITSSSSALLGLGNLNHYAAAKGGLISMARTLANEWASDSIRINSICPTAVRTDMVTNEATYKVFRPDLPNPTMDDCMDGFYSLNLLPVAFLEPRDVSNAVLWLASDEARYITGVVLPVDAGQSIKVG
ncbi:SDR family mycofactocin-dependent oxidoreductase [Pseudarthrobacter sp. AG30]|nr:SDR family mycofactocin-dependent oxidoreductase [Pseudarthrobacter sp. AG30]